MRTLILAALALGTPVVALDGTSSPLLAGRHVGTYAQARRVLGAADRLAPAAGACVASWPRRRLEIRFASSGGCARTALRGWLQVTIRSASWRTRRGLAVGDTATRLHALYPGTTTLPGTALWKLETGGPLCDGGAPLALAARLADGRVAALVVVHVPACG
jgi:hypothetical protein